MGGRASLHAQTIRPEVEDLMNMVVSDFITQEANDFLIKELTTRPDITADLFAALDRDYFHGLDNGHRPYTAALACLQYRKDLTPSQLTIITDEMTKWIGKPDERNGANISFVRIGISVLYNYPSPDNEDLALKFIDDKDRSICESLVQTLGIIGTRRSRDALAAWRERWRARLPDDDIMLDEMNAAIAAIDQRLAAKGEPPGSAGKSKSIQREEQRSDTTPTEADSQTHTSRNLLPWSVCALIAGGAALWLSLKLPGRSRRKQ